MKTEQEIRNRLEEISTKIDLMYRELKNENISMKSRDDFLCVLQTREDMLEWVLEETQNGRDS